MYPVGKRFTTVLLALLISACGDGSSITESTAVSIIAIHPEPDANDDNTVAIQSNDPASATDGLTEPAASSSVLQPEPELSLVYTPDDITDLILVTGQSNALGLQTAFDTTLDQPHNRVFAFTDSGWQTADLHQVWDHGWHPRGNPGETPSNNFAFHMAKEVVHRHDHRVVGFILATAPGESIGHWDETGDFWGQISSKVLDAINQIPHKSRLDGILWHQGESDEGDNQYHVKLDNLIASFRQQNWFASQQPFICGETAVFQVVNSQLMALNYNGDHWTGCVSSDNLSTRADGYHFDADGLREIGKRYATKYLAMIR